MDGHRRNQLCIRLSRDMDLRHVDSSDRRRKKQGTRCKMPPVAGCDCQADRESREQRILSLQDRYCSGEVEQVFDCKPRLFGKLAIHCSDGRIWATSSLAAEALKVSSSTMSKILSRGSWMGLTFIRKQAELPDGD